MIKNTDIRGLLSRDQFREQVFARDQHKCVFCDQPAVDAHHIIERRLWPDGGYYLDNGASVCEHHHLLCEQTVISVEDVGAAAGIQRIIVPPHLYADQPYDKWGNPVLPNGQRLKGELFNDESVQKVLAQGKVLDQFTSWVKYPRTHHLPWSVGINSDDRVIASMKSFEGRRVIVTEKMDGENTTMYNDYIHARSIDGRSHPSRNWVKQYWSTISADIPSGWRLCGENLFAKHSISYDDLPTYFMGFSMWDDHNNCLCWDDTVEWFRLLGVQSVPVLFDGIYDENKIKALWNDADWESREGYVLRIADQISYSDFRHSVGKFVRANHIQTVKHWMYGQPIVRNNLTNNSVAA